MRRVGSLWRRAALAVTVSVASVFVGASYTAFKGMLWTEDAVLEKVLGAVLRCSESSEVVDLNCLGVRAPQARYQGNGIRLIEDNDVDVVADARGRRIETEPFEVLDPLESTIGGLTIAAILVVVAAALAGALLLIQRALMPVMSLEAILRDAGSEHLPDKLRNIDVPSEVEGLRLRLVEALESAHAARTRERMFSRYVSHELRTPLSVSVASLDLLQEPSLDAATVDRSTRRLRRALDEMQETISTLLGLARAERGAAGGEFSPQEVVAEELERARALAEHRGATLVEASEGDRWLDSGEASFRLALRNLVSNAIRHGGKGRVVVTVAPSYVSVADDGPGVADGQLAALTKPFETFSSDGYGLGLALVDELCGLAGWRLALTSPEGLGLCATIHFESMPQPRRVRSITL